jgi:hypothetical protein
MQSISKVKTMDKNPINRKQFLTNVGKICACSCAYAMTAAIGSVMAQDSTQQAQQPAKKSEVKKPRAQERIEFAEEWVVRFFNVLDENMDEPARKKLMMANGKACLLAWQKETNQQIGKEPVTLERFGAWVKERKKPCYEIDGKVIYFQYMSSAETGKSSPEKHCLCPMVETNPAGLSSTFFNCSLGYVKEMHEQIFKKPVNVQLLSSVLRGDPRCKFKITVL